LFAQNAVQKFSLNLELKLRKLKLIKMDSQELQKISYLEQNLRILIMQKQAFEMELSETISALSEVKKSKEEVYRIVGQVMIKSSKEKMIEELESKKKLIESRIKTLEKQKESFEKELLDIEKKNSKRK
jgi:prefoldin beta subunit